MDLLDAFDAAIVIADCEGDDDGSRAALSGSAASSCSTAPPKRRRIGGPALFTPTKREVKVEEQEEGGGLVAVHHDPESVGDFRPCTGCARIQGVSPSFWHPADKVAWGAASGRGNWCRDCHNCWRLFFAQDHPLVLFAIWLSEADHFKQWEEVLVCYLMLQKEGCLRVTTGMISDRLASFKWALDVLCLPRAYSVVDLVQDLPEDMRAAMDPRCFVHVRSKRGLMLGLFSAAPQTLDGPRINRPLRAEQPPPLNGRAFLTLPSQSDRNVLQDYFGAEGPHLPAEPIVVATASPAKSKLHHKFDVFKMQAVELLKLFGKVTWESVKESSFTKLCNTVASIHADSGNAGDKTVQDESEVWMANLARGKDFTKRYRDFLKTNGKVERLVELNGALVSFRPFLVDVAKVECAVTFDLLFFKSQFFATASEQMTIEGSLPVSKALATMMDAGLPRVFSRLGPSSDVSAEAWLRAILFKSIGAALRSCEDTSVSEKCAQNLLEDASATVVALTQAPEAMRPLTCLVDDIRSYCVLLRGVCNASECDDKSIDAAMASLQLPRLNSFKKDFESPLGKEVLAANSLLLQASAKHKCATDKVALATKILTDKRLPNVEVVAKAADDDDDFDDDDDGGDEGTCARITNFCQLADMGVVDTLDEAHQHVVEAMALWQGVLLETHTDGLATYCEKMISTLKFCDECLNLFLESLTASSLGDLWWSDSEQDDWTIGQEMCALGRLKDVLDLNAIDDTPFFDCVAKFVKFLKQLPANVAKKLPVREHIEVLEGIVMPNTKRRSAVLVALDACVSFRELPEEPSHALEEWKAKRTLAGDGSSTFLSMGVDLLKAFNHLPSEPLALDATVGNLVLELRESEGNKPFKASFGRAALIIDKMRALKLPRFVETTTAACVQLVVDDFADSLALSSIALDAAPPPTKGASTATLVSWLESCFHKSMLGDNIKLMAKVFAASNKKDVTWPCIGFSQLTEDLVGASSSSLRISLPKFCMSGCAAAPMGVTMQDFKPFAAVLMCMSQMCLTVAFLRCRYIDDNEPCVRDHMLKEEITNALGFLRCTVNLFVERLNQNFYGDFKKWDLVPWIVPFRRCAGWASNLQAGLPMLSRYFLGRLAESITSLSLEVSTVTPQVDHVINEKTLNDTLARKHLLGWTSRQALNDKSLALHTSLVSFGRWRCSWGMEADSDLDANIELVKNRFDLASGAILTIAALNVILELTGPDQTTNARKLINGKKHLLKASLVARLQKLADEAPAPKVKAGVASKASGVTRASSRASLADADMPAQDASDTT